MNLLVFVSSFGAVQGVIILISILFKFRHQKNLPLALLLIVFSVRQITIPTWNPDVLISHPWLLPFTTPLPFLFGPFLWWYIRELSSNSRNVPKLFLLHLIPYFLEVLMMTGTVLRMEGLEYEQFIHNVFTGNPPLWLPIRNGFKVILNVVYLILSARLAFRKNNNRLSVVKRLWIRLLVIIPTIVLTTFAYVAVFPSASEQLAKGSTTPFILLSITMSILIYSVSLFLLVAPEINTGEIKIKPGPKEVLCSTDECEQIMSKVEQQLSEGIFKNPDLLLADLAAEVQVHPNRLSFAINQHLNTSFKGMLNQKRLSYFLRQVDEGQHPNHSILELAFRAGFPSKSTFNRVFKENMGISPTSYISDIQKR